MKITIKRSDAAGGLVGNCSIEIDLGDVLFGEASEHPRVERGASGKELTSGDGADERHV